MEQQQQAAAAQPKIGDERWEMSFWDQELPVVSWFLTQQIINRQGTNLKWRVKVERTLSKLEFSHKFLVSFLVFLQRYIKIQKNTTRYQRILRSRHTFEHFCRFFFVFAPQMPTFFVPWKNRGLCPKPQGSENADPEFVHERTFLLAVWKDDRYQLVSTKMQHESSGYMLYFESLVGQ